MEREGLELQKPLDWIGARTMKTILVPPEVGLEMERFRRVTF